MKNKIKKFGALVLALMLLVSGFGNLRTVLAEDNKTITNEKWELDDFTFIDENKTILYDLSDKGKEKIKVNKDLVIPDGVKSIYGYETFKNMQIKSVTFPDSLIAIYGDDIFLKNEITKVNFGKSLEVLNGSIFYANKITELSIPESVKEIGTLAFAGNNICKLTLPQSFDYSNLHDQVFAGQDAEYKPTTNPFSEKDFGDNKFKIVYYFGNLTNGIVDKEPISGKSKIFKYKDGEFKFSTGIESVELFFVSEDNMYSGQIKIYNPEKYVPVVTKMRVLKNDTITIDQYKGKIENLPEDINGVELKTPANTSTIGSKTAVVTMIFEDNSTMDIEIPINVFDNKAGVVDDEIGKGNIHAEKEIVPWGGEYDLTDNIIGISDDIGNVEITDVTEPKIDTQVSGDHVGKVKLVFDDGSELIVDVPVEVLAKPEDSKKDADKYNPEGKDLTVKVGEEPKAEDAINNKKDLPEGTKYEWKETPDTNEPGSKYTVVVVTYPDGSTDEVSVNINVIDPKTDAEKNPANKPKKTEVEDKSKLTPEEKAKVEEEVKKVNPEAKDIQVKDNGDTTITYPDGSTNKLPGEDTVVEKTKEDIPLTPLTPAEPVEPKKEYSKEPKVGPIYEDDTKITGKGEPRAEIEIKLPNRKTVYGTTDRDGYFEIETKIKLYEDEKVYVTQIEYGKEPSKEITEVVRRSYGHRNDKKDTKKNTTSTSNVIGVLNSVQEKLITSDHSSYIVGYPNGNFGPNNTITRAEVATIFARLSKDQRANNNIAFKDVKSTDWFNKAVKIGVSQGFINGYGDGTFKPDKPITRAEFASVIATYANKTASSNAFNDVNGWSVEAIDTAYANGWMQGNAGTFRPNDPLTRAEAVTVINRMLDRQADRTFITNAINSHATRAYKDINSSQWYFYDVYAASWGHNYTIENGMEKWTGLNGKAFTIR